MRLVALRVLSKKRYILNLFIAGTTPSRTGAVPLQNHLSYLISILSFEATTNSNVKRGF